jgi:hypothetical protein
MAVPIPIRRKRRGKVLDEVSAAIHGDASRRERQHHPRGGMKSGAQAREMHLKKLAVPRRVHVWVIRLYYLVSTYVYCQPAEFR